MPIGRRGLLRNAAVLAAASGCARRIAPAPELPADLDAQGQIHLRAATAPQLQSKGGAVALRLRDLSSESPLGFGVLLINLGPKLIACDRDCPHAGCELAYVPEDREIECPCHGSRFASDGTLLNPPATTSLNTYPVTVDAAGDFTVHLYPGDGTFPAPGGDRKLVLDLPNYPALAPVHGYLLGRVEGPPGALLVTRISDTRVAAVDAICTHRFCTVRPKPDGVLHCPCHGSEFSPDGAQVVTGPATAPLRNYPVTVSGAQVIIDLS